MSTYIQKAYNPIDEQIEDAKKEIKVVLQRMGACTADYDNECTYQDANKPYFWDNTIDEIWKIVETYLSQTKGGTE